MNIGIIGNGGREHSLCYKLSKSTKVSKLFCFPGNAGTDNLATNVEIDFLNFNKLYNFVKENQIDLIIVGPEAPLVEGIVDFFEERKIKVFGPNRLASKLEGSKIFMKQLCENFNIPTAKFKKITTIEEAKKILSTSSFPVVVKSDGLASGKGVTICDNEKQAINDVKLILNGKFKSSKRVVIEEFLKGEEASFFVITDGINYKTIGTAQDHKRIGQGDTGLNTGGMGAYSPSYLIDNNLENKILNKIIEPTILGMKEMGFKFKGILYAGLMIHNNEPKLIEYNIRFGDPECQVLMMRLKNDLLDLILSVFDGSLMDKEVKWLSEPGITIVAASDGYPGDFEKNVEIKNINNLKLNEKTQLFHASTIRDNNGKIRNNGGRVLSSTVVRQNLKDARRKAIKILEEIDWQNKYFRKDIGFKIIDK